VHEYYADYFAVTPSLFHVSPSPSRAQEAVVQNKQYSSAASWAYDRDFQGLLAVMLSLKKRCDIRYAAGSDLCKRLGMDLSATIREEQELFTFQGEPTLLLLLDRRDDAVTPLLTQWTYQAMVHELLGIHMNRINLATAGEGGAAAGAGGAAPAPGPKTPEQKQQDALRDVVLSSEQDDFFRSSMLVNFGELGLRIKRLVSDFQALTRTQTKLESIEDMQRFVDNYPQFKLQSGTVSKHVSVMGEISKVVNARSLLTVSALEQEIVCGSEHQLAYEKLHKLMDDREVRIAGQGQGRGRGHARRVAVCNVLCASSTGDRLPGGRVRAQERLPSRFSFRPPISHPSIARHSFAAPALFFPAARCNSRTS